MVRLSTYILVFSGLVSNLFSESLLRIANTHDLKFISYQEFVTRKKSSDLILTDQNGEVIQTNRVQTSFRRIQWWDSSRFSSHFLEACLHAEDRRFWDHEGVDGLAVFSAWGNWILGRPYRGGSTITMQVVSFLDSSLGGRGLRRSVSQKIKQIQAADDLEKEWTKSEILSAYFNLVPMRGEWIGIPIASFGMFKTSPEYLDRKMSLLLTALIRSPNANSTAVFNRMKKLNLELGWNLDERELHQFTKDHLEKKVLSSWEKNLAYHYANRFHSQQVGLQPSSLDYDLQTRAIQSLKNNLKEIREQNVRDGGVIVLENNTGYIKAYVGGIEELSSAKYVDSVSSHRQAGSTLKPFLYSYALEKKLLTSSSLLLDEPLDLDVFTGMYRPSNYDKSFQGKVTTKIALASSLNIPAVRTIVLTGIPEFHERLKSLGFNSLREPDYYGYSLALGTADISLYELTRAYAILARNGKDFSGKQVVSPQASFIVSEILSDREARSGAFGLENQLSTKFWSAVKTGTSQDMRDNWCVGFTRHYTVGVWVGNFSGEPMRDITGITGACPVWRELMEFLNKKKPSIAPTSPEGVVAKYNYLYLDGTTPSEDPKSAYAVFNTTSDSDSNDSGGSIIRIRYPVDGMIFAIDPDIPPGKQKILFEAGGKSEGFYWFLNGKKLGKGEFPYPWSPQIGRFKLGLGRTKGNIVHQVSFAVR